jgi:hypothetical protein
MTVSCKYGDEPAGSGATELANCNVSITHNKSQFVLNTNCELS